MCSAIACASSLRGPGLRRFPNIASARCAIARKYPSVASRFITQPSAEAISWLIPCRVRATTLLRKSRRNSWIASLAFVAVWTTRIAASCSLARSIPASRTESIPLRTASAKALHALGSAREATAVASSSIHGSSADGSVSVRNRRDGLAISCRSRAVPPKSVGASLRRVRSFRTLSASASRLSAALRSLPLDPLDADRLICWLGNTRCHAANSPT